MIYSSTLNLAIFGAVFVRPPFGLIYEFGLALVHMPDVVLLLPARALSGTYFLCTFIEDLPTLLFAHLIPSITSCPSSYSNALLYIVLCRTFSTI